MDYRTMTAYNTVFHGDLLVITSSSPTFNVCTCVITWPLSDQMLTFTLLLSCNVLVTTKWWTVEAWQCVMWQLLWLPLITSAPSIVWVHKLPVTKWTFLSLNYYNLFGLQVMTSLISAAGYFEILASRCCIWIMNNSGIWSIRISIIEDYKSLIIVPYINYGLILRV